MGTYVIPSTPDFIIAPPHIFTVRLNFFAPEEAPAVGADGVADPHELLPFLRSGPAGVLVGLHGDVLDAL